MTCPHCAATGIRPAPDGEPAECPVCHGTGDAVPGRACEGWPRWLDEAIARHYGPDPCPDDCPICAILEPAPTHCPNCGARLLPGHGIWCYVCNACEAPLPGDGTWHGVAGEPGRR